MLALDEREVLEEEVVLLIDKGVDGQELVEFTVHDQDRERPIEELVALNDNGVDVRELGELDVDGQQREVLEEELVVLSANGVYVLQVRRSAVLEVGLVLVVLVAEAGFEESL